MRFILAPPGRSPGRLGGKRRRTARTRTARMQNLSFRLPIDRHNGETRIHHALEERFLNQEPSPKPRAMDRLAAHLKQQAREVMRAVTECPPAQVPQAVARLADVDATIALVCELRMVDEHERAPSDANPLHAHTLGDFRLALEATRNHHRAPAFVTRWTGDLADLRREIGAVHAAVDLLAAVISGQERGEA